MPPWIQPKSSRREMLAVIVPLLACGDPGGFVCERDDQCSRAGEAGTCEAGFCAFPDTDCDSGKRYGELSGERAGECVPGGAADTGTTGPGGEDGPPGATGDAETTGGDTLAVSADASAGDTSAGEATTSGDTAATDTDTTGGSSGDSGGMVDAVHNYVFITSNAVSVASFGGLAGADARCNDLAADAGLPGEYVAWLSTSAMDAIDRVGDAQGWARLDGLPFARSAAAIVALEHVFPIRLDENGVDRDGANAVTATAVDGTYAGPGDCGGWTSAVGDALRGSSDAVGEVFTDSFFSLCDASLRTYCFGIDDAISIPIVLPPPGRLAFVSSDSLPASAGIDAFDAQCADDAAAAGLPGEFSALVATSTTAAADRFDTTGPPWSLVTGVPVVLDAADLALPDATLLAPVWLDAEGVPGSPGAVWQGSANPAAVAAADTSCADWSVTTGDAATGTPLRTAVWWGNSTVACSASRRVICLQQ